MTERSPWRFIPFAFADAATNMAVDEAILEAHQQGLVPPTLRLYGFDPPAVSIGHSQSMPDGLVQRAKAQGLAVVRRPTGGRAVLHLKDLTYSFVGSSVGSQSNPNNGACAPGFLSKSVAGAYKQICQGLENALSRLGVNVELGAAQAPYRHLHDCFLATTGSDLHFRGMKMVGSAQLRRRSAVLQHGSILLNQDQAMMTALLGQGTNKEGRVNAEPGASRHANLFQALGKRLAMSELEEAIEAGFASAFAVQFRSAELTDIEMKLVKRLRAKYSSV